MTYANTLKYAGADPYAREEERLPYPVYEALTNGGDDVGLYQELAEVRWLADKLESDAAGNTDVHEEVRAHLFRAVADTDAPLQVMVDYYVGDWLARRADALVDEWGIDRDTVAEAYAEYHGPDESAEVAADA
jgi:hypothetical protein